MRSGRLRHRVEVHGKTDVVDAAGELIETWAKVAGGDRWANIRPVSGKEGERGGRQSETTTHKIRLRWLGGLTAENRVIFGTRTFEIESVLNFEDRNEFADLMCEEIR